MENLGAVELLRNGQEAEVLTFLGERPTHTVMLAGLIRDNGLVSELNRGSFYGHRAESGLLDGVVLIGEIVMFEARSETSLTEFARLAQFYSNAFLIIGEQEKVAGFWDRYGEAGQEPRRVCRELFFELQSPVDVKKRVPDLRLARQADLELVMKVHAQMALDESGVDPLEVDPEGFRQRCLRRIEQGRVWIWVKDGRLIFKADVISDTPDAIYLEGIYTDPLERHKGIGSRCLSQLSRDLLSRTKSICLLTNELNRAAHKVYRKSHYQLRGFYDTIFLRKSAECVA